jgi:signal transduction histidine kinase
MRVAFRWGRPRSIRARTTLVAAVVMAVALTVAAVSLLAILQRSLERAGDDLATSRARDVAGLAESGRLPGGALPSLGDEVLIQVVDSSGAVIASTRNAAGAAAISSLVPPGPGAADFTVEQFAAEAGDPEDYRVWALPASSAHGPVTVYAATSVESVGETMATVRRVLVVGLPVLLVLLIVSIWLLVGRALRPVEDIRSEVADISQRRLDHRVPVPPTSDEISRLAVTMNSMLDRLESASLRQQRFVADASHELQSPLAALRTQLEVAIAHRDTTDWPRTATELLAQSRQLERLVRDLLFLARLDEETPALPADPVDLDDVVLEEAVRLRPSSPVRIDTSRVSAAPVLGSHADLIRLSRNLLENAEHHAESLVRVELSTTDGVAELVVADDGPGVPPEQRERVFDRFVRLNADRSRDTGGTGLGLAIVKAITERHGGTVRVEAAANGGARFIVRLPVEPVSPAAKEAAPAAAPRPRGPRGPRGSQSVAR